MGGVATQTARSPERAWEVTPTDRADLVNELACLGLPKPPIAIIEVFSLAQVGDALRQLQRTKGIKVELHFPPSCPDEVFEFAFNLPKAIPQAIERYNRVVASVGTTPKGLTYGLTPAAQPPMLSPRIDPAIEVRGTITKEAVIDLSRVGQGTAAVAAQGVTDLLKRAYECHDNPALLQVEMPRDRYAAGVVQREIVISLNKPENVPDEEVLRQLYLRKRLELLDLFFGPIRLPGARLLDLL